MKILLDFLKEKSSALTEEERKVTLFSLSFDVRRVSVYSTRVSRNQIIISFRVARFFKFVAVVAALRARRGRRGEGGKGRRGPRIISCRNLWSIFTIMLTGI